MARHARQVQQQGEARRAPKVPIAELPRPRMRSPSQWPGTARPAASTGRWLIMISGEMKVLPRPRVRALGIRSARPVRKQTVSSRHNHRSITSTAVYMALAANSFKDFSPASGYSVRKCLRGPAIYGARS
jgi:hypothetical protein